MNSNINKIFGQTVAELRVKEGISQEELAFRCGIHRTYIGAIERGEKSPTLNTIYKISKGLNMSMAELWEALEIDKSK
jgi:transcriptional regulator with XRE-family HTH domain